MEATTIHGTIRMLYKLVDTFDLESYTEEDVKNFNDHLETFYADCRDFIAIHYITNREDTPFWKNFTTDNKLSDNLKKFLDEMQKNTVYIHEDMDSWVSDLHKVYYGSLGTFLNNDVIEKELEDGDALKEIQKIDDSFNSELDQYIKNKDFFNMIINDELTIK